jgi:hypothetical protein
MCLQSLEKQGVEGDSLSQSHPDDGLDENFAGSARITANGFNSLGANEAHPDGGGGTAKCGLDAVGEGGINCSDDIDHISYGLVFLVLIRFPLPGTRWGLITPGTGPSVKVNG